MADTVYDVYADSLYKKVSVIPHGSAAPSGMTLIGDYTHPDSLNANELGPDVNHVMFHRIRDLIYKKTGLATVAVGITFSDTVTVIVVDSIDVKPAPATVKVGATVALTVTILPANAADKTLTWTSSDETVATVSSAGVITGIKEGDANIKATSSNGVVGETDVTVTAADAG